MINSKHLREGIEELVGRSGDEVIGAVRYSASTQTRAVESCCDHAILAMLTGEGVCQQTISSVSRTGTSLENRAVAVLNGRSQSRSCKSDNWEKLESDHCFGE